MKIDSNPGLRSDRQKRMLQSQGLADTSVSLECSIFLALVGATPEPDMVIHGPRQDVPSVGRKLRKGDRRIIVIQLQATKNVSGT